MRCIDVDHGLSRGNKGKSFEFQENGDCIECTSHDPNADGYIRVYAGVGKLPRMQFMHRLVWENQNGGIPQGYEVDHICRNRKCCNIDHLQLLTIKGHKVKTNEERYADRIEGVIFAICEGFPNKLIEKAFSVSSVYVNRYRRNLNKGI